MKKIGLALVFLLSSSAFAQKTYTDSEYIDVLDPKKSTCLQAAQMYADLITDIADATGYKQMMYDTKDRAMDLRDTIMLRAPSDENDFEIEILNALIRRSEKHIQDTEDYLGVAAQYSELLRLRLKACG